MEERVGSGVSVLDTMLSGGLYVGASCVVKGAPGTGKTTLALQFLDEGMKNGEAALYITFEEFSGSLYLSLIHISEPTRPY
jgi:circadian clock protein KaiC